MVSQPPRLQSSFCALSTPSSFRPGGARRGSPIVDVGTRLGASLGPVGLCWGLRGGPGTALQRGGAPFPGDTEKAGAGIRTLPFTAFSAQAGCRKWRANGFRDYLPLFKEKKNHFNFANSPGVLKLAGILGSVQEKKGLEAAGGG